MVCFGGGGVPTLAACGDDGPSVPVDATIPVDAGPIDAERLDTGVREAGPPCADEDGDGASDVACGGADCDDTDPARFPGAVETCDGDDEDCDDTTLGPDGDGDGYVSTRCCNGPSSCGDDCDDALNTVNPRAAEVCNAGRDDDCDGVADAADGVCVSCPSGYSGIDEDCVDVDECATSGFCGDGEAACTNIPGSFVCTCVSGYVPASPMGGLCENVDECAVAVNPCRNGACTDNAGSYLCTCDPGYRLVSAGSITCVDVDECLTGTDACDREPRAACSNTEGGFVCACPAGYVGTGRGSDGCLDVDECALGLDDCDDVPRAGCSNVPGGFTCGCPPGYAGSGRGAEGCADVDECALGIDDCADEPGACSNTPGGYRCACPAGYAPASPTGSACINVDECAAAVNPCGAGLCFDTPGSYVCTCPSGYGLVMSPTNTCVDLDECRNDTHTCDRSPAATCRNEVGGFSCTCPEGTVGSGLGTSGCVDVDECAAGTADCDTSPFAVCTNTLASFVCACPSGYTGSGRGVSGCLYADPALSALVPGAGASLNPVFAAATANYRLFLPPGVTSTTIAPSVALPARASITVDGISVTSGTSVTVAASPGLAPRLVSVVVTTESGASRTYGLAVVRSSTYFKASNPGPLDQFGNALAISADGSVLAVGAPLEDSAATGIDGDGASDAAVNAGAVYLFRRVAGSWAQEAYLKAPNTDAGDYFGGSLALSADGSVLAVGAAYEDSAATGIGGASSNNAAVDAGAVYVYRRSAGTWTEEAYVKASNTGPADSFGVSVALSAAGDVLAVGAPDEDSAAFGINGSQTSNGAGSSGAVYVFRRSVGAWAQEAYVKALNTGADDRFGSAVALSATGDVLAVGAPIEKSAGSGFGADPLDDGAFGAGAAYVFQRTGGSWGPGTYFKASNTTANAYFGRAVSLSADGAVLAVGAYGEASAATGIGGDQASRSAPDSGAVYVFRQVVGAWSQEAYVKASNTTAGAEFGNSVSLSGDATLLVVGAPGERSIASGIGGDQTDISASFAGAAYAFRRSSGSWRQEAYLKASNPESGDSFGRRVVLAADVATVAVSALDESSASPGIGGDQRSNGASRSGAVYVF
jgi:hypothetical protein